MQRFTGHRIMTNDCQTSNSLLLANRGTTAHMPSKVHISCWHRQHRKAKLSARAIVVPTWQSLVSDTCWEKRPRRLPVTDSVRKYYVTELFSTVTDDDIFSVYYVLFYFFLSPVIVGQYQADSEMSSAFSRSSPFPSLTCCSTTLPTQS